MIPLPKRSYTSHLLSGHKITIEEDTRPCMWSVYIMEMRSGPLGSGKHMLQSWVMEGMNDSGEFAVTRVIEAAFGVITDRNRMSESSLSWDDDGHLCWKHGHAILYFVPYPITDLIVHTYDHEAMAAVREEVKTPIRD